MINVRQRYPIIVFCAILLHATWAIGIWSEPAAINATGLHTLLLIAGNAHTAALIFACVASLACLGLMTTGRWVRCLFLLPQQAVLWFSVMGAANAMLLGQFADGIQRAHWFLIVDQIPVVLIALGHTIAMAQVSHDG